MNGQNAHDDRIDLSGQGLTALPAFPGFHLQAATVRHLNLWRNRLERVDDALWAFTELESLVLADNGLRELPLGIAALGRLEMLDLGHNALVELPAEIGELRALRRALYVHDNSLIAVPESIGQLDRLIYLNLSDNELQANLDRLMELDVRNNRLGEMPPAFEG